MCLLDLNMEVDVSFGSEYGIRDSHYIKISNIRDFIKKSSKNYFILFYSLLGFWGLILSEIQKNKKIREKKRLNACFQIEFLFEYSILLLKKKFQ